ncbi:MAG: hypothetical protein Fur0022_34190 [Anaerolineales bacterium]
MNTPQNSPPPMANWVLGILILFGVAGFLSVVAAAIFPDLTATIVKPVFCVDSAKAHIDIIQNGKYTMQQLTCETAEGQITGTFTGAFRLVWASVWMIPTSLLFFLARKWYLHQNKT